MSLIRRPSALSPRSSLRDPWSSFPEFDELFSRMNTLLARWPGDGDRETLATSQWSPAVNISETDKAYTIQAELPEVERKNVHVKLEQGVLTIEGERERRHEEKDAKFHRVECAYGHFMRRFTMPDDAEETGIKASFRDGMLNVTVPKSPAKKPSTKEIAIS